MKIYTSYFYQVRFMKPYMIPLSTARFDPKWYHQNKGQGYVWKDKNGVYNGLRAEPFAPDASCEGLCRGKENCETGSPQTCLFLKTYRYQLDQLDYNNIISRCERIGNYVKALEGFNEEPVIILLVHEAYNNPCSERKVIQDWFASHGQEVLEWHAGLVSAASIPAFQAGGAGSNPVSRSN